MSTRTDLTINVLNNTSGKKTTNKLSYVNPDITNSQAVTLAEMITDLTKDTYQSTTRTDTTDCDTIITRPMVLKYAKNAPYSNAYDVIPSDGVINYVEDSSLTRFVISAETTLDSALQILDISDTAEEGKVSYSLIEWGGMYTYESWKNKWCVEFTNGSTSTRTALTPRQIKFRIHFDATTQYDAYDKEITVNITAAS